MAFEDLYQEIILDHYRHPRNFAPVEELSDGTVHENPTCGDSIRLSVEVGGGVITSVRFNARGCAISVASASMMSDQLGGLPVREALERILAFLRILRGEEAPEALEAWGDLAALGGVAKYPIRVKCATLAWHAAWESLQPEPANAAGGS